MAVQTLVRRRVTDSASGVNLDELAEAHAEFDRRHAAPLHTSWKPHENTRALDRPLRLGFLSPDLGKHPIGYFLIRVLENLERREDEIICYSDRITRDELTSRFQTAATTWSNVAGRSDERLVQQIRVDRIDTLFDLAGHTAQNRFFFARKPAPIQITWIGYFGTTGLTAMDYILADRYVIPAAAESHYRENVLRMPNEYLCLAMGLADDLSRLAKWRAELRERMARSPLCDGPRFAGNLMNLLRGIWREWCLGP